MRFTLYSRRYEVQFDRSVKVFFRARQIDVEFDENAQERDCTVLFKFSGEFDIWVSVIEAV